MNTQEIINAIALTRLNFFTLAGLMDVYRRLGSATAVIDHRHHLRDVLPEASDRLMQTLAHVDDALARAEAEMEFCSRHSVRPLTLLDDDYPERMKGCDDAPLVVFYRGTAQLNQRRVVSMVGTRHCTPYGHDLIMAFMKRLRELCPDVLVVSGLAYGVDIAAHRQALRVGYDTVGVLAHGLDTLYPARHRDTAVEMTAHGGLLTEFLSQTRVDKVNFVRRNRIVAGMADVTILVESAAKGGGLITAGIAQSYGRDVMAFPGAVGAPYSEGCNNLIRDNGAQLITGADDFVELMGWQQDAQLASARRQGIERTLFPQLTADEQRVVALLQKQNDLQLNVISVRAGLPVGRLTAILFQLEMKGVVRTMAGGMYHLIGG